MKFKYFVRGLGMGILFCTLILFAAYQTSPNKLLTDEEVKTRAKELGMVDEQSNLDKVIQGDTPDTSTEADTTNKTEESSVTEDAGVSTEDASENSDAASERTTEEKKTVIAGTTEEKKTTTEITTEERNVTTEGAAENKFTSTENVVTATITIKQGMLSSAVARLLEDNGIIDSASEFDRYLNKQGYSTKICVGTYTVKSTDSYERLAKILTKQ